VHRRRSQHHSRPASSMVIPPKTGPSIRVIWLTSPQILDHFVVEDLPSRSCFFLTLLITFPRPMTPTHCASPSS
jgi:hypothetical protein